MLNEETGMQQRGATSGLTFRETVIADRSALMTLKCSVEIRDVVESMNFVRNEQSWRKRPRQQCGIKEAYGGGMTLLSMLNS